MKEDITRAYSERVQALSDALASTQEQLETLKSDKVKEKQWSEDARWVGNIPAGSSSIVLPQCR